MLSSPLSYNIRDAEFRYFWLSFSPCFTMEDHNPELCFNFCFYTILVLYLNQKYVVFSYSTNGNHTVL